MPSKFFKLVARNLLRSRTRLLATVGGCTVGAFIVCFFFAAQSSLDRILARADSDQNLIVTQRDRF